MIDDAQIPGSPAWWLLRLAKQLIADRPRYQLLERYLNGQHPLPEGDPRANEVYRQFQRKARSNYTGLVVESVRERLKVVGFRTGGEGTADTDRAAWLTWQANHLDADQNIVHRTALALSRAYVIVGPGPTITIEDPRDVTHEPDPLDRRRPRAALKLWSDSVTGRSHAVVYLPDVIVYYRSTVGASGMVSESTWELDPDEDPAANGLGEVPVVAFTNRPNMGGVGLGEFEDVIDIQDRINNTLLDRLVIAKMQAYRQRWAKGVSLTDDTGKPVEPFIPGVDLLWAVEDDKAAFGDFEQANLGPLLDAVRSDIRDLAAITRTPPHYLLGEIVNASGDALKAAETGLVAKAKDRQLEFGEAWEQVNRLAGAYAGRLVPADAEVIWADPESRSMAELADAAVKQQAAGVTWRQRMVVLGYTPAEIERMETERATDALNQLIATPAAVPAPPLAGG